MRRLKTFISFILMLSLMLSIFIVSLPINAVVADASESENSVWDGKSKNTVQPNGDTYTITSPGELAWFRDVVQNGSVDFSDYVIEITGNFDFNNMSWNPINVKNKYLHCKKLYVHDCTFKNLTRNLFSDLIIDECYFINTDFIDLNMNDVNGTLGAIAGDLEISDKGRLYIYDVSINGKIWGSENTFWGNYRGNYGALMRGLKVDSDANIDITYVRVDLKSRGLDTVGGLIAQITKGGTGGIIHIEKSSVHGDFFARDNYGYSSVFCGGMIGEVSGNDLVIEECVVDGSFKAEGYTSWSGGMIAKAAADTLIIKNCQFNVSLSSHSPGGILGHSTMEDNGKSIIQNCFVVGNFSRYGQAFVTLNEKDNGIPVENCYFDYQKSNLSKDAMYGNGRLTVFWEVTSYTKKLKNCKGLTSVEAKIPSNFANWDFNNVWKLGDSSPVLIWNNIGIDPPQWSDRLLEIDSESDKEIVELVKRYTTAANVDAWDKIMQSSNSDEEKFRQLSELSSNMGLNNPAEGIKYLQDTSSERWAYKFLTTNEAYCANDFGEWINNDAKARSILYSGGMIFNMEWASYLDFTTYVKGDYPGVVKCKKVLKDFMTLDDSNFVTDSLSESKKTEKALKNILKLNDIVKDAKMDRAMDRVLNAKSESERESAQEEFAKLLYSNVQQKVKNGDEVTIYIGASSLSEVLDYSSNILGFIANSADDVSAMINMEESIETYQQYKNFLTYIYNNYDISRDMRIAAYQLLDDINNGYYNKLISMMSNITRSSIDFIYIDSSLLKTFAENELGISATFSKVLGEIVGTLTLATYISNLVLDTGEFVKNAAYTCSYAELSKVYDLKRLEDEQTFLNNQTPENAWKFYEDYNVLWKLRYCGEKQYSTLTSVKAFVFADIKTADYKIYDEIVSNNLEKLKDCRFSLPSNIQIPKSVQYASKSIIDCPVNVEIYNKDGELIATLEDGKASDVTNEYGRFAVVRDPYREEYAKVICLYDNNSVDLRMVAQNMGVVSYRKITTASSTEMCFDNIVVEKNDQISVKNDEAQLKSNDGEVKNIEIINKNIDNYVGVTGISTEKNELVIEPNQKLCVAFNVSPLEATNKSVYWHSFDDSIVKINNGVIEGVSEGNTKILLTAADGNDINTEINVTVKKKDSSQNGGSGSGGDSGSNGKANNGDNTNPGTDSSADGESKSNNDNDSGSSSNSGGNSSSTIDGSSSGSSSDSTGGSSSSSTSDSTGKSTSGSSGGTTDETTGGTSNDSDNTNITESEKISLISKKKGKILKLIAGKKKLTVKAKKVKISGLSGIRYQYAIKLANGKKWKKYKSSKLQKTFKKLKSGKTYWVSVRPYIKIGGKTYYGIWSKTLVKKVK